MKAAMTKTDQLTAKLTATAKQCFVPNYPPAPMVLSHGSGARLWDSDGNEYIDFSSGISVNSLGHQNPELVAAMQEQASKLWHVSNHYYAEPTIRLAEELIAATFADRIFFCNSGAEANETAIKVARKYASCHLHPEQRDIVTFYGGFHGRTLATVTATAQPKYQDGFGPLPAGFRYCEYNNPAAAAAMIDARTCAVLVEPVQGESGVFPASDGYLTELRRLCDSSGALLMLDEVQTGMGRTGELFAYMWEHDCRPDVVTVAKALGGGLPIGAVLMTEACAAVLQPGSHGSTFGGNPVVTAVARAVLACIGSNKLLANVQRQGAALREHLHKLHNELPLFAEIRGKGLMIGAVLNGEWQGKAGALVERCRHHGVLVLVAGQNVLRFLPPLNIDSQDLDVGIARVATALREAVAAGADEV